jgi:hypothetical protein
MAVGLGAHYLGQTATATALAAERGIQNATFEVASVIDYPVDPLSYDMTLFSGVWGAPGVGLNVVDRLLKMTRRQLVARIQLVQHPERALQIHDVCDRNGFHVLAGGRALRPCLSRPAPCRRRGRVGDRLAAARPQPRRRIRP